MVIPNSDSPDWKDDPLTGDRVRPAQTSRAPHTDESPTLSGDDTQIDLTGAPQTAPGDAEGETRIGTSLPLTDDADATQLGTAPGAAAAPGALTSPGSAPGFSSIQDPELTGGGIDTIVPGGPGEGPLAPGHAFGSRYHIVSVVGVGGMGAVYKAWDQELGVLVALKVIRPEVAADPEAARALERRFKQELLLARKVTHKNVVRIHDLGEVHGIKYITMPFIEGEDLADILKREGKLPVPRVMALARTIVSGLAAAHEAGIVHRDLKPANIMVEKSGEALIMDFGVARSASPEAASTAAPAGIQQISASAHTVVGSVVGTVEYMAPEQARAQPVDQRADIYAIGLILYDMLLGRKRAEHAKSAIAELTARMQEPPPSLRQIDPSIPESLDRIVAKCVQPDPALRFHTTADLVAEIESLDDNGKPKPIERKLTRKMVLSVAAVFAAIVALTWWFAPGRAPVTQPKPISVLVADFDNRTGDQAFAGALEQALSISMEGASFVNAFSRPKARQIAEQNIKPGASLDESVARLVARREAIDVVLAGTIQPSGSGYSLTLRALHGAADPNQNTPLATATATANDRSDVLLAVNRAAADLRKRLGDTADESVRMAAADIFTARSMEALKTYAQAQELQAAGQKPAAFEVFERAIAQDPDFTLAYSGAAVMAWETGRTKEAHDLWRKMLGGLDRMTERERYRALGTYYLGEAANYDKAIENYSAMVQRYPADRYARSNLALAYFFTLNMPKALEEGRRAVELDPKNVLIRSNYALYAMYAGDFPTAVKEARAVIEQGPTAYVVVKQAYLPLAIAAIASGDFAAARDAYRQMGAVGAAGASLARTGLADLAMYQGWYAEAETTLTAGIAEDIKGKNTGDLPEKYVALAEAYAARKKTDLALKAIGEARRLGGGRTEVEVPAAAVMVALGRERDAAEIGSRLSQQLQPQVRAYGRIIEGTNALAAERFADAVDSLTAATKLSNVWLARYRLGVAYVQAEHYAEGLAELDTCSKRRGEATALFLNEVPTFHYLAPLSYWLGRAQEGVGDRKSARESFEAFVKLRGNAAPADPLVADARARLAKLPAESD
jgi:serine/threonine protein kinase/tetratricopeptide (TPR) repeat protein